MQGKGFYDGPHTGSAAEHFYDGVHVISYHWVRLFLRLDWRVVLEICDAAFWTASDSFDRFCCVEGFPVMTALRQPAEHPRRQMIERNRGRFFLRHDPMLIARVIVIKEELGL